MIMNPPITNYRQNPNATTAGESQTEDTPGNQTTSASHGVKTSQKYNYLVPAKNEEAHTATSS